MQLRPIHRQIGAPPGHSHAAEVRTGARDAAVAAARPPGLQPGRGHLHNATMRAEIQQIVSEIEQAIALLRRHL
jgi:hypothetical protein